MKCLLIFLFSLSILSLFAQESKKNNFNRFQLGFSFSPDVCYRTLKETNASPDEMITFIIDSRNEMEIPKFGYTGGLNFNYSFNHFLSIESGIHISNKGHGMKKQEIVTSQPEPGTPTNFKFVQNYYYLDFPLKVNFTIGKNKLRFVSSIGATTNLLIKESQTLFLYYANRTEKSQSSDGSSYNSLNISPLVSIGMNYHLTEKMSLRIEPTFRYGLLKIIDAPITAYLFNAGLNVGYYIGL